ncbi:Copper-fist domain-containing protein [Phanerochaete sordida]|uniref:Copper-fist domain-containing protein n=1 Tax=Phanerochaete sordida TaxID=48140 RepID=A0A9P3LHK3_9APHY|nr:Copper-fist domain-containing protein [Phanerochaete sordida]
MVFVNDKKYACESCIKGHRSSSCGHADRPLFEVKKKGRPVSQCDKCRELRKTKRMHSKCQCATEKADKSNMKQLAGKSKRYIPILPALPNGLKDTYPKNDDPLMSDPKSRVDNLLNPCHCKDIYSCSCNNECAAGCSGLDTLAKAAALCCGTLDKAPSDPSPQIPMPQEGGCCQKTPPASVPSKRPRRHSSSSPDEDDRARRGPSLPPLHLPEPLEAPPVFPVIPPLSSVASIAGTGCTCGFDCTCPGCEEHRGPSQAANAADCPECGHCTDNTHGLELPSSTGFGSSLPALRVPSPAFAPAPSFLDAFFARAAATIPPPPSQRAGFSAFSFDPQNVTVYPPGLFAGERARLDAHGPAFGLVRLPKLECCAGKCGCAGDSCGCGQDCNGCCAVHEGGERRASEERSQHGEQVAGSSTVRSCCATS